jgi:AraC-like DNA-binding protein
VVDVLSDVLDNVRLTGSLFFLAEYREPWCLIAPSSANYAEMLVPGARNLVVFHVIVDGRCMMGGADDRLIELSAGDAILIARGDEHLMADKPGRKPTPLTDLLPYPPWREPPSLEYGGNGKPVKVLCGYLHCADAALSPFLATLPSFLKVDGSGVLGTSFAVVRRLLIDEATDRRPGCASILARLTETFFIEALRQHIATTGGSEALKALADPVVGKALELIHDEPARDWSVEELAREAAASRSLFASRFTRLLGCPPMQYLARWRLQIAARLLTEKAGSIAEVAAKVGYESEAAFNRAFKRHMGAPPATWLGRRG